MFQTRTQQYKANNSLTGCQIPWDAKDNLPSLLQGDYNSSESKSPMDVGRTNLFPMDIPTTGPPIACKLYPIPLKHQTFIDEEIRLLENAGCITKHLNLWTSPVVIVPKNPDPLNPQKQQLCLVLDYWLLNKSIKSVHNGNSVISYYPLPNIRDLLAKLQKYTLFFSLGLRSGFHHIGLTPNANPKRNSFCHNQW